MDNTERRSDQTTEEQCLFPTAVSEEELQEARRKSMFKQLFGSSQIFLVAGEKRPPRPDLQASLIIQSKAAEHYANGQEAMEKFQYEKAVICFSRAITLQPEQTQLYVSQAEAYLQLCDFQSAAACYKKAWLLEPGAFRDRLAFIYYLQGQCLFDRRLFPEALEAFSKAAEVKPGCRAYTVRSLACLTATGHLTDCLQLVNDWMVSDGVTSDLYVLRARLHQQLHQMSQCYRDVTAALALNPACPEAGALLQQLQGASEWARQKAVDRAVSGQLPEALCMINVALDNGPQDPRLYLFRGILYRRLKDFTAAIEDLVQAVELSGAGEEKKEEVAGWAGVTTDRKRGSFEEQVEFQLVLTYNDFAVQCFSRGQYAEATLLLNKAIKEEKGEPGLYLNRGGEGNLEAARRDLIHVLVLDPTNEELSPMLMSLFPGYSVSDVLSGPGGRAVTAELMDVTQTCSSTTDQQRLSEKLQQMTLTNQSAASRSASPPEEEGEELKLCMNQQEVQVMVKSLLQVQSGHQK
ncbi:hypothetical protein INR49_008883 [Caranx melampygus]|nr:hypothetical protein INR49_008883 [Caranx melampygus]